MKPIITLALLAASTIATAGPALTAPRLYVAVALPGPAACGYSDVRAAVLMRELAPSLPALTAHGCGADAALAHLMRLENEGYVERIAAGWRVK